MNIVQTFQMSLATAVIFWGFAMAIIAMGHEDDAIRSASSRALFTGVPCVLLLIAAMQRIA